MRIALAQINPTIADIKSNKQKIIDFVEKAKKAKADLVVFPETATVGYPTRDLVERKELVEGNLKLLDELKEYSKEIGIILGYIDYNPFPGEKPLYNAAALLAKGEIAFKQYKSLLPEYDVFDERRYFEPARCVHTTEYEGTRLGISICEDIWIYSPDVCRNYKQNPCEVQTLLGADILINLSASPYYYEKPTQRIETIKNAALQNKKTVVYVTQVGGNDELIFDGKSVVVNEKGQVVAIANNFEEDLIIFDTETGRGDMHSHSDLEIECIYRALQLGLKDYVTKCGFKKVVLGLSGGIDSALTAAIAVKALGKENVVGLAMPGPYSSQGSVDDAKALADNFEIEFHIIPINKMFEAALETFQPEQKQPTMDLAEENLQARLRGNTVMAMSNRYGYLALTTGNKSETAVGYATLYGDMCGGLGVISDLYKTQVYELSNYINEVEKRIVIPENTITKPPSAELKPDQKDEDSLPPYDLLDKILKDYIERGLTYSELADKYDKETVKFILQQVDKSEYKRRQAAVGLKISTKAFGSGRRLPIAQRYNWQ